MAQNNAALELLDLLATRNFDVKPTDLKTGNPPVNDEGRPDNSKANFFEFDFIGETGQNYGTVEIVLTDGVMTVASGNNTGRSMTDPVDKESWFDFLQQLKNFGVRNGFNRFDIENISRMKYLKQSIAQLTESFQGRGQYSWSGQPTEARMLIKHSHRLSETDARFRHIESIFIETTDGERYRLSTRSLSHGRAMLEHVRAGGRPWDARGTHINHMVEQLQILSRFRRAHQGRLFEGDAAALIDETNNYFGSLRRNIKSLATKSGYSRYFESWQPDFVADQELVVEDLRDLFVETRVDPRIEQALPLLAKIKENNMKEADIFEAWANRLTEGTWAIPDTEEKMTKLKLFLSQPQAVGADADNATAALGDILGDDNLFDQLEELAETDPDADARPVVQAWLKANQNYPEVMAIVRELEQEPDVDQEISMTAQDMPDQDSDMREGDNLANPLEEVHSPGAMAMFPEQQGVAEGSYNNAMAGLQKTIDFAKQHGYKIYRSPSGRKMRFVNKELGHEIRAQVDNDGDSINVNFMDYSSGTSGNDDASYFDQTFKRAYEQALKMHQYRSDYDDDDEGPYTLKQLQQLEKQKQGMAEGVNDYLWHGSRNEHKVLYPRQANDTGGKEESNKNAVYATPNAKVAIAMGLTTPGSDTGMFPNDPQMVLFKGNIRKGQMVYLHKVPKDLFIKHNGREWYSKPGVEEVKPIEVVKVPVDKYLKLIRQATPADLELQKKYMKQQGVAEGSLEEVSLALAKRARDKAEYHVDWDEDDLRDRPEGYSEKQRSRFQRYIDRKESRAKGDRDWDPPKKGMAEGSADKTVKVVKRNGKPIGEIGVDPEASPGNGPYYVKLYDGSVDESGFDTAQEALAELKYLVKQGVAEGRCNMSEAGMNCPVHGMTECYMETVQTDPKGFAQPTGAAFESQLARIRSLALLK